MSLELPEQRQRVLAGLATLLRIRVLDPQAAVWTAELRSYVDDLWFTAATVQRRLRQDLQIAVEGYIARAVVLAPDLVGALADVRVRIDLLAASINDTIDRLVGVIKQTPGVHGPALQTAAGQLERSIVALYRWFVDLQVFDDAVGGSVVEPAEPEVAAPSEDRAPPGPSWPERTAAPRERGQWWRPADRPVPASPWPGSSIHGSSSSPSSLEDP